MENPNARLRLTLTIGEASMNKDRQISTAFVRQFKHLSGLIRVGVNRCTGEVWSRTETSVSSSIAWNAYHAIRTLEMRHMLGIPAECMPPEPRNPNAPSKAEFGAVHKAVADHVLRHIQGLTDREILEAGPDGDTPGARNLIYALRHAQHHVGVFVQLLKQRGIRPPAWSSANMI